MSAPGGVAAKPVWRWLENRSIVRRSLEKAVAAGIRWPQVAVSGPLVGAIVALYEVFPPRTRAVVIDEWAYLKAATQLGAAATYRPDPTAIAPDLIPVALSALLGKLAGNEVLWLRATSAVSFVAMGVLAVMLARELGAPKRVALACGLLSAVNPIAMPLAVTGMSDLPAAAAMWGACLLGIKYLKKPSAGRALGCCGVSLGAATIRPTGIVPAAVVAGLALLCTIRHRRALGLRRFGTGAVAGLATIAVFVVGVSAYAEDTVSTLHYLYQASLAPARVWAKMILLYPVQVGLYIAAVAVPLSAGILVGNAKKARVVSGGLVGGGIAWIVALLTSPGTLRFPYMSWGSVVSTNGVGGGDRPLFPGTFWVAVSTVIGVSAGVLACSLTERESDKRANRSLLSQRGVGRRLLDRVMTPTPSVYLGAALCSLVVLGGVMGFAFEDTRTGYDRYLIPLFGPALALTASRLRDSRIAWKAWAATSIVVAALVVVGVQDWAAQRRTAWTELESLTLSGVPPTKIDGGFEWSAYHQPAEYDPVFDPKANVPWYIREFAPDTDREYVLSAAIQDGYQVVKTVRWRSWLREGTLYLQVRSP